MAYHVYIVSSGLNGTLYVGVTNNLARRIWEHQSKTHPGFTSRYDVINLVYYETFPNIDDAIAREKQLKRWSRSRKCQLISSSNPTWDNLAPQLNA